MKKGISKTLIKLARVCPYAYKALSEKYTHYVYPKPSTDSSAMLQGLKADYSPCFYFIDNGAIYARKSVANVWREAKFVDKLKDYK